MPRFELSDGNVIIADQGFIEVHHPDAVQLPDSQAPVEAARWPALDWYRRFTSAERIAIRALAASDPVAFDFMQTLDHTISAGANVLATDPDLIAGLNHLQSHPVASPVLTAARAAALLAP